MADGQVSLALAPTSPRPGYRLSHVEIYNWGTFHGKVWRLDMHGESALLTGANGAGKSTVVDAITTLLVPSGKHEFNKAAGAEEDERSLRSYVLGYYKSQRNTATGGGKPKALRDSTYYTVLLSVFRNEDLHMVVTLAQVLWVRDGQNVPERFYAYADRELNIREHFANFGSDMASLRKKLRNAGAVIEPTFKAYSAWFCRVFGLTGDQPLQLFNQAISMKSVGNLTTFVREQMLPPFQVRERIENLIHHFDDLVRAHDAVVKAKQQIGLLLPLVADCHKHASLRDEESDLRRARDAIKVYFAKIKLALIEERSAELKTQLEKAVAKITRLETEEQEWQARVEKLTRDIAQNGGDRINEIDNELKALGHTRDNYRSKYERYCSVIETLNEAPAEDEAAFYRQRERLGTIGTELKARQEAAQQAVIQAALRLHERQREYDALDKDIRNLEGKPSNIDVKQLIIRRDLCAALGIEEMAFPFVGELLQIREEARDWEGAAERVLRGFALTMVVPEAHKDRVDRYVNDHYLRGRLDYNVVGQNAASLPVDQDARVLARKVAVKTDSPFAKWVRKELSHRASHICCTIDELAQQHRGVTKEGLVKEPGDRRVKDDRSEIHDRSKYVLGWDSRAKVAAMKNQRDAISREHTTLMAECKAVADRKSAIDAQVTSLARLAEFADYRELDWRSVAAKIASLEDDRAQLQKASNILQQLTEQLERDAKSLADTRAKTKSAEAEETRLTERQENLEADRASAAKLIPEEGEIEAAIRHQVEVRLGAILMEEFPQARRLELKSCEDAERELREAVQGRLDALAKRIVGVTERILKQMGEFNTAFSIETQEIDANVDSAAEYGRLLERLQRDDLPRFERQFKEMLNENAINEIANFNAQLGRERANIEERVRFINESLRLIPYNPERFIELKIEDAMDEEIRTFRADLRACTTGGLAGDADDQYSESKFAQVKKIIDRFRGRPDLTELDRAWTVKVTDVRQWCQFGVSERWRATDVEQQYHADSVGKSGGQKEKLAYTILAAGLTYQFGINATNPGARSFSFVCIDEAFSRANKENAHYGLSLFQQLGLQLLVVTPNEKVSVIEPFVKGVCFMQNSEEGDNSRLLCMTIEEYKERERLNRETREHEPETMG